MTDTSQAIPEVDVHEAARRATAGALLIDCRERDEFEHARIPGAVLVPLSTFADEIDASLEAGREVLMQCRSGARSARATAYLRSRGVEAFNVAGGILAWSAAGLPIDGGTPT